MLLKRNKCQHFAIFLGAAAAGPLFLVFIDTILVIEAAYTATGSFRSQTFAISFTSNKSAQANEQALDRMQLQCYGLKNIRPLFLEGGPQWMKFLAILKEGSDLLPSTGQTYQSPCCGSIAFNIL